MEDEMVPPEAASDLLDFFKALADPNRLKIVGLLAQRPHTVEELAAALGVGASTASHHLSRLSQAGLTEARAEGYYSVYSLRLDELQGMAQRLLSRDELRELARDEDVEEYDRKVLASFTDAEGRFTAFPVQRKKLLVLLRRAAAAFEPGVRYPEREVNERLSRFTDDYARLRRELVGHGLMQREGGGGEYWLKDAGGA
jgi:predicted transcriptional regulator